MYTRKKQLYTIFWFFVSSSSICHLSSLDDNFRYDDGNAQETNSVDIFIHAVYIKYDKLKMDSYMFVFMLLL